MSISLMTEVWKRSPYSDAKLLVHLALADWANDDGTKCYPTHEQIAEKCRCSDRTVRRLLASMIEDGVLEVVMENGRAAKGSPRREYVVRVTPPTPDNLSTPDIDDSDTGHLVVDKNSRIPPSTRARVTVINPAAAKASDGPKRISDEARAAVKRGWDERVAAGLPRPALAHAKGEPFLALARIVQSLLDAGEHPEDVGDAIARHGSAWTLASLQVSLGRCRRLRDDWIGDTVRPQSPQGAVGERHGAVAPEWVPEARTEPTEAERAAAREAAQQARAAIRG